MEQKVYDICMEKFTGQSVKSWEELLNDVNLFCNNKYNTGEQLRSGFKRARQKHKETNNVSSSNSTANPYVVDSSKVPSILNTLLEDAARILTTDQAMEEIAKYNNSEEFKADGTIISDKLIQIIESTDKTPNSLMLAHGFDPTLFDLVSAKQNMWNGMKSKKFDNTLATLCQSKIVVKPKSSSQVTFKDIDEFFTKFKSEAFSPNVPNVLKKSKDGSKVLEIDLADLHIGNRPYELNTQKSIEEKFRSTIQDIYEKAKNQNISKIYLIPLGDVFHFDTFGTTTTGGTQLESNGMTFSEMFDVGTSLFIEAIDLFSKIAPVETVYIGGNHDKTFGYFLVKSLEFYYRMNKNIVVDATHQPRKFRKIGNSLVGLCHGDMPKQNIHTWLKTEARKEWGETIYAEVHAGHFHSQTTLEKDGLIVRYLPSMTSSDVWHYEKGYVGAVRSTVSFLWDKESGLEEMWFTNV